MTILLAACSGGDDATVDYSHLRTVTLLLQVPETTSSRADASTGDPGTDFSETANWDRLAIIFAYSSLSQTTGQDKGIVVKTLTKSEFTALTNWTTDGTVKEYPISIPDGKAYVYGVTYSSGASTKLESDISDLETKDFTLSSGSYGNAPKQAVEALTIPNSYATTSSSNDNKDNSGNSDNTLTTEVEKFLSVATGFYKGTNVDQNNKETQTSAYSSGSPALLDITQAGSGKLETAIPLMRLSRLACMLDVQWDCANAFSGGKNYTDVRLDQFAYSGGASQTGTEPKGYGRLFPTLYSGTEHLGGSYAIINNSEISRRNGRTYMYLFPDGTSGKSAISFHIWWKAQQAATVTEENKTHELKFSGKLLPATWYKVNLTVSGSSSTSTVTINN